MNDKFEKFLKVFSDRIDTKKAQHFFKERIDPELYNLYSEFFKNTSYINVPLTIYLFINIISEAKEISDSNIVNEIIKELKEEDSADSVWYELVFEAYKNYNKTFPYEEINVAINDLISEEKIQAVNLQKVLAKLSNCHFAHDCFKIATHKKYKNIFSRIEIEKDEVIEMFKLYASLNSPDELQSYNKYVSKNKLNSSLSISKSLLLKSLTNYYQITDEVIKEVELFLKLYNQNERKNFAKMFRELIHNLLSEEFISKLFLKDIIEDFIWTKQSKRSKLLALANIFQITHSRYIDSLEEWSKMRPDSTLKSYEQYQIRAVKKLIGL